MGIDEALLDRPGDDKAISIGDLMASDPPAASPSQPSLQPPPSPSSQSQSLSQAEPRDAAPEASQPPHAAVCDVGRRVPADLAAISSLDELRAAMAEYDGCALKNTASNMIFADGNPAAQLMVIGEVPGRDEDRVGLPLVGSAGQLFDRMLASIGLSRADTYITTLIPWRPPGNRTPTDEEMALLMPWLLRHIQLVDPARILLLGGAPAKALLPQTGGILKLRGRWHDFDAGDGVARPLLATLHPSYLIRSPGQKRLAYADLLALADKLG